MLWVTMTMVKSRFSSSISSSTLSVLMGSSAGRLVQQDHFGPHGDGAGDAQALLLAAGQAHGRRVQPVLHLVPQCAAGERPFTRSSIADLVSFSCSFTPNAMLS